MKISVYKNKGNRKKECNCLEIFYLAQTQKVYLIVETDKKNKKDLSVCAFIFDLNVREQVLENIVDNDEKKIVNEHFQKLIKEKSEKLNIENSNIIKLHNNVNYKMCFNTSDDVIYTARIDNDILRIEELARFLTDPNNGVDIDYLIEKID
ncbi:MAG: hypothetical protein E7384_04900 [Ruminococcaceae bacterium]|nr:hypothetical protein [Oscillospiraceae bacterium]